MFRTFFVAAVASLAMLAASAASATTYSFSRSVGADGMVSGFFETDGTIGALSTTNVVGFSITIQDGDINGGAAGTVSSALGDSLLYGSFFSFGDLVATATDLLFDFDSAALIFANGGADGFWCVSGVLEPGNCETPGAEVIGVSGVVTEQSAYTGLTSIASISMAAIPLPAGLPLLLAAFGSLALLRRKAARTAA